MQLLNGATPTPRYLQVGAVREVDSCLKTEGPFKINIERRICQKDEPVTQGTCNIQCDPSIGCSLQGETPGQVPVMASTNLPRPSAEDLLCTAEWYSTSIRVSGTGKFRISPNETLIGASDLTVKGLELISGY